MAHGSNWRNWPFDIPGWIRTVFDKYAHALTVIDEEHRLVHDGMGFQMDHVAGSTLANGATGYMMMVVGARPVHLRACDVAVGNTPVRIRMYRTPTVSANGTELSILNANEMSSNTPLATCYVGPTVTDPGTQITDTLVPDYSGPPGQAIGAIQSSFGEELILAINPTHLLAIPNNSGAAISWGFKSFWYEISYQDLEV